VLDDIGKGFQEPGIVEQEPNCFKDCLKF